MNEIEIEGSLNIPAPSDSGETDDNGDSDDTDSESGSNDSVENILNEPYQHVYFKNEKNLFVPGKEVTVDLQYTTSDLEKDLTGLTLNIHYNSSLLSVSDSYENGVSNALTAPIYKTANLSDRDNLDNDSSTDKLVQIVWGDFLGNILEKIFQHKLHRSLL